MADAHSAEGKVTPEEELTGNESIREVLEIALNSEKEAVVFYFGLKSFVSQKAGKDKVEAIILEELSHVTALLNELKKHN
jgi:rubrerythrin